MAEPLPAPRRPAGPDWLALPAGLDAAATAERLRRARAEFLGTGTAQGPLRPCVRESWHRCAAQGPPRPAPALPGDRLRERLDAHPLAPLRALVHRLLAEDAVPAGMVVAVGDADGVLLWLEGGTGLLDRVGRCGFVPGADWSEAAAGTNAPGTALATGRPVQVYRAEHLAEAVTAWSCSAAPVHGPDGRTVGVLDLTGGTDAALPAALSAVRATAAALEAELRARASRAAPATPSLRVLGTGPATLDGPGGPVVLRPRHAELLLLLARAPAGLSADDLASRLHDDPVSDVTTRAELVRLRAVLAGCGGPRLLSRPYRLDGPLPTDLDAVEAALAAGDAAAALRGYPGPVLPRSWAPGVVELRERTAAVLRDCLAALPDPDPLLRLAARPDSADDPAAWRACRDRLPPDDPRLPAVLARLRHLDARLGGPAPGTEVRGAGGGATSRQRPRA